MGNLAKDTTELDLWAFDDAGLGEDEPQIPASKPAEPEIPAPRPAAKGKPARDPAEKADDGVPQLPVASSRPSIKVNIGMKRGKESSPLELAKVDADFDDLDSWDEPLPEASAAVVPEGSSPEPVPAPEPAAEPAVETSTSALESEPEPETKLTPERAMAEKPAPVSLKPNLGLSKLERFGMVALVALLLVGAGVVYMSTISRLPKGAELAKANDFPISGQQITVDAAETYWRVPVTEGPNQDTFRRDTLLLPVASLQIGKGSGAVRIFFRNGSGELVGDAVTRAVHGAGKLDITATAGFEDAGMYAGYRAGLGKVWTIEVHEADSESAPATGFRKLFEMSITSDRR